MSLENVASLFQACIEQPPSTRRAYLQSRTEGNQALFDQVWALLEADQSESPLVTGAFSQESTVTYTDLLDTRVGPYQLHRVIGQGGSGIVFLGVRSDGQFEQDVAIKCISSQLVSPRDHARFAREQQILAQLKHSHIAHIMDAGILPERGTPYFIMEYVEGLAIDVYCKENHLPLRQRIALFLDLCQAVDFAHRNMVIHRDLKPGNTLVTRDGVLKLLDFGISKFVDPESPNKTATVGFTPKYAAPEQLTGGAVSAATDIFALGTLFYELITGNTPFDADERSPFTWMKQVIEETARLPSQRTNLVAIEANRLKGDLDAICMKAIATKASDRYASVQSLMQDLTSFEEGRPIAARKRTWLYTGGKFLRRNWAMAILVAGGILAVASFTLATLWQAAEIRAERDKSEAVKDFMIGIFSEVSPVRVQEGVFTAKDVLELGAAKVEGEWQENPVIQSELFLTMGRVFSDMGLMDQAKPLLDRALEIREQSDAGDLEKAQCHHALTQYYLGKNDFEGGIPHARACLEFYGRSNEDIVIDVLNAKAQLAELLTLKSDLQAADDLFNDVIEQARTRSDVKPRNMAVYLTGHGQLREAQGRYQEAETVFSEALALTQAALGENHYLTAVSWDYLARVSSKLGNYERANDQFGQALQINESLLQELPNHPSLLTFSNNLAGNLLKMGEIEEAELVYLDVLERSVVAFGERHFFVAGSKNNLARVYAQLGQIDKAKQMYLESIDLFAELLGESHPNVAITYANLGDLVRDENQSALALDYYSEAHRIFVENLGSEHRLSTTLAWKLGRQLVDSGQFELADETLIAAEQSVKGDNQDPLMEMNIRIERARLLLLSGQSSEAELFLQKMLDASQKSEVSDDHRAKICYWLGRALIAGGQQTQARAQLLAAREFWLATDNAKHVSDVDLLLTGL